MDQCLGSLSPPGISADESESVTHSVMSSSLQPYGLCSTGSSIHGIIQARIQEWVATPFSRGSYQPKDQTRVSCVAGGFFAM